MRILITTLGIKWALVPELLGFTNPQLIDVYRNHPRRSEIEQQKARYNITPVDELWIICTDDTETHKALKTIGQWQKLLPSSFPIRAWVAQGLFDLITAEDCKKIGGLILQVVMTAAVQYGSDALTLSLVGGRKTMSTDMYRAATIFGCAALLHILDNKIPSHLNNCSPEVFLQPLRETDAGVFTPVVISGRHEPNDAVLESLKRKRGTLLDNVPLPDATALGVDVCTDFYDEVNRLVEEAQHLLYNYRLIISGQREARTNYRALYTLPPRIIRYLQETKVHAEESAKRSASSQYHFITALPKADLHCHFGGFADPGEAIAIARENIPFMKPFQALLDRAFADILPLIAARNPHAIAQKLRNRFGTERTLKKLAQGITDVDEFISMSAFLLLFEAAPELLEHVVFDGIFSKRDFCGIGIEAYESLGDIQGSVLLQTEPAIRKAVQLLLKKAKEDNVRYLELRCSPENYTKNGLSGKKVLNLIRQELASDSDITTGVIVIASRHGERDTIDKHVTLVRECLQEENQNEVLAPLVGFDLAGNEQSAAAQEFREMFLPVMERCLHFTIHAGEIADAGSIWQAVYHLNADRIGHGLTLRDQPDLMARFRDRSICIEMCPSSNYQVVGFKDFTVPETESRSVYPLKTYLDSGLTVTINTDNMGISRTSLSCEFIKAAHMTPQGLSLWEIIHMIRSGFKASFLPFEKRRELLLKSEGEIMNCIKELMPL